MTITGNISGMPNRQLPSPKLTGTVAQQDGKQVLPDYDIIVIGGGINGTAIARDAATRLGKDGKAGDGLKVLLLEKNDFGWATSAWNSRLIHGGLRYLENVPNYLKPSQFNPKKAAKETALVEESLQERERLLLNAPHLVRPLPSAMPIFDYNQHGKLILKMGMMAYDALSSPLIAMRRKRNMPRHDMLNAEELSKRFPGLRKEGLQGGPVYFDAQAVMPERLSVENALAAYESGNATIMNHAEVTGILVNNVADANREASGVTFKDTLTGEEYTAKAKVIINAAGPWVDDLIQKLPQTGAVAPKKRIGGIEGTHIVVRKFPGAPDQALYIQAKSDNRPFFILPWRDDLYLIGTTERELEPGEDLDTVKSSEKETGYLLTELNNAIPDAKLSKSDILYTYSGVRPLPYEPDKPAHAVTRSHIIEDHGRQGDFKMNRFISIIGGKLTTARNLAEEAVDAAIDHYGLRLPNGGEVGKSQTRTAPMPGGEGLDDALVDKAKKADPEGFKAADAAKKENIRLWAFKRLYADTWATASGVPLDTVKHLMDIYGSRASKVLEIAKEDPTLKNPLYPGSKDIGAQVAYGVRYELARTVSDVLMRRIGAGLDGDAGSLTAGPVADIMARELGWNAAEAQAQVRNFEGFMKETNLAFKN